MEEKPAQTLDKKIRGASPIGDAKGRMLSLYLLLAGILFLNLSQVNFSHMNDEGLYAQIGWEMYDHHEAIIPTWFNHPAYYKPPLLYWLMFPFFKIFGRTLLAARLPSAIIGILTLWITYLFGKRIYGEREGFLSAAILATSINFVKFSRNAMMEPLLMFFFIFATYCFYRASEEDGEKWLFGWFAAVGASCLVKGPISALILVLSAAVFCLATRRFKFPFKRSLWIGLAIGLFLAMLWPFLLVLRGQWNEWWNFFIIGENLGKFQNLHYGTSQIWGSYLISILPWSFIFLASLILILFQGYWREKGILLNLILIATTFAVFLLPATRLTHYTVPVIPSGALIVGLVYSKICGSKAIRAGEIVTGGILAVGGIAVLLAARVLSLQHILIFTFFTGALLAASGFSLLLKAKRLPRAALFMALALVGVSAMAGGWNYAFLPQDCRSVLFKKPAYVYKDSTYLWSYHVGKEVIALDDSKPLKDAFQSGGRIAITESDLNESGLKDYRILCRWTVMKTRLNFEDFKEAIKTGRHSPVEEQMFIIEKKSP